MTRREVILTDLDTGSCVEIIRRGGTDDGKLVGYAIRFAGGWEGWVLRPDGAGGYLGSVGMARSRDEAVRAVLAEG